MELEAPPSATPVEIKANLHQNSDELKKEEPHPIFTEKMINFVKNEVVTTEHSPEKETAKRPQQRKQKPSYDREAGVSFYQF
jgi:hypothetical protein